MRTVRGRSARLLGIVLLEGANFPLPAAHVADGCHSCARAGFSGNDWYIAQDGFRPDADFINAGDRSAGRIYHQAHPPCTHVVEYVGMAILRELIHHCRGNARIAQGGRRAFGGDDFEIEFSQLASDFDHPGLVGIAGA